MWVATTFIAATAHLSSLAHAEPSDAEKQIARERYASAREKLHARRYRDALAEFVVADDIMGVPTTGLGRAIAHERLGQLIEARDLAMRVSTFPADPSEPRQYTEARTAAAELVTQLSRRIPSIVVRVEGPPRGASVMIRVDDTIAQPTKGRLRMSVNPGNHETVISTPGYVTERRVVAVAEAAELRLEITMTAEPTRAPTTARRPAVQAAGPQAGAPGWIWGVGSTGLVALAVGSVFAVDFAQAQSMIHERCPEKDEYGRLVCTSPFTLTDARELETRRNRDLALGIALGGVGAAAVGISIAGFLMSSGEGNPPTGFGRINAFWVPARASNAIMVRGEF